MTHYRRVTIGIAAAAALFAGAPVTRAEKNLEAEAIKKAPRTNSNAPEPNWVKQSMGLPHQGKREMLRRLKRMRQGGS